MSTPHLEIEDSGGRRRAALTGPLRLAAEGGDLPLSGAGAGELQLAPGRAEWLASAPEGHAAPPQLNGRPWTGAHSLVDGDRIEWGAVQLVYRAGAEVLSGSGMAELEELELVNLPDPEQPGAVDPVPIDSGPIDSGPIDSGPGQPAVRRTSRERAWRRVWSGLLVEQQLVAKQAARTVQEEVRRREFDADAGADLILAAQREAEADQRILDRARALQRDLLMAPLNTGARRAVRRVRNRARSGLAYLTAQFLTLSVYSFLVLIALVLLRHRGVDLNGLLDGLLGLFGGGAG